MKSNNMLILGALAAGLFYLYKKNPDSFGGVFDNLASLTGSLGKKAGAVVTSGSISAPTTPEAPSASVMAQLSPAVQNAVTQGYIPPQYAQNYVGLANPGDNYNPADLPILITPEMSYDPKTNQISYI